MRFTRPNLPKLNIDLAELRVTSNQPARFEGVTSQGRIFEGKYRNGWLHLHYLEPDELMFEAPVGDAYDMTILPEQVCDLVGLTILGETPVLSRERFEAARREFPLRDWSGATTYWSFNFEYTSAAGRDFLAELEKLFPGTFVNFEYVGQESPPRNNWAVRRLTDGVDLRGVLYLGIQPDDPVIVQRLQAESNEGVDRSRVIGMKMPIDTRSRDYDSYDSAFASKQCGRTVHIHPTFKGHITGDIRTDSEAEGRQLDAIEALVARHFFDRTKVTDIDTGEVIEHHASGVWYSKDLVDWCDAKKMKFLGATSLDEKTRAVGFLPDLDGEA